MVETEQKTKGIRVRRLTAAQDQIDPESLWLDWKIAPEELVRLDPLDITGDMVDMAEQPELADYILQRLPTHRFSLRAEAQWRRQLREKAKAMGEQESPGAFAARLGGGGPSLAPTSRSFESSLLESSGQDSRKTNTEVLCMKLEEVRQAIWKLQTRAASRPVEVIVRVLDAWPELRYVYTCPACGCHVASRCRFGHELNSVPAAICGNCGRVYDLEV